MQSHTIQSGFSLVEMLIYISIVVIVAISSVTFLLSLDDVLARQQAEREIRDAANIGLERILYEVRQADTINVPASTLQATPGILAVTRSGTDASISLSGGVVYLTQGAGAPEALTPTDVTVTSLYFYAFDNTRTELARVVMEVETTVSSTTIRDRLEGAVVLRGSYE